MISSPNATFVLFGIALAMDAFSVSMANGLNESKMKINNLDEKMNQLKNDGPTEPELTFEEAKDIFSNAESIFKNADIPQQRVLLQSLIKKIVLSGDEVQIYWRFE